MFGKGYELAVVYLFIVLIIALIVWMGIGKFGLAIVGVVLILVVLMFLFGNEQCIKFADMLMSFVVILVLFYGFFSMLFGCADAILHTE